MCHCVNETTRNRKLLDGAPSLVKFDLPNPHLLSVAAHVQLLNDVVLCDSLETDVK